MYFNLRCLFLCAHLLSLLEEKEVMYKVEDNVILVREADFAASDHRNLGLRLDSLLLTWNETKDGSAVEVREQYGILGRKDTFTRTLLEWRPEEEEEEEEEGNSRPARVQHIWERRRDLGGLALRVSLVPFYPSVFLGEDDDENYRGYFVEVMHILQKKLNFRAEYRTEVEFGVPDDSGGWSGAVGSVAAGSVDLALDLTVTPERAAAVDFSMPVFEGVFTLLVADGGRTEEGGGPQVNFLVFFDILEGRAWLALAATVAAVAAAHSCLEMSSTTSGGAGCGCGGLLSGVLPSLLSLIQQSSDDAEGRCRQGCHSSSLLPSRILLWSANFGLFLSFAFFSCDLTATMTAMSPPPSVASFRDVLESGMTLLYPAGSALETVLDKAAPNSSMRRVSVDGTTSKSAVYILQYSRTVKPRFMESTLQF